MKRAWRWVAAGLAAAAVAGVVGWSFTPQGRSWWQQRVEELGGPRAPDAAQVEQVSRSLTAASAAELEQAKEAVRIVHERMNQIVGWGHLAALRDPHSPAWAAVEEVRGGATLQHLRQVAPQLRPATVGQDLEAFFRALEEGWEHRDPDRIRTAHRIIHDLDYFVFNHKTVPGGSRDYWGATLTLEGEDSLAAKVLGLPTGE